MLGALKGRNIILHEPCGRHGSRVVALSAGLARLGIQAGMALVEATALAGRDLHLEEDDPVADRAALERLAEWCERFSPHVGLEDAARPESLFLDVTGLGPLFGGEAALAEQAARAFRRHGLLVRLAIADTWGAAWALAHYGDAALIVAPVEQTQAALNGLPVEALRLPAETIQLLWKLGIQQIGQLLALPRDALTSRLGPALLERLNQAIGTKSEVVASHRPLPEIDFHWSLEEPTARRDAIQFILSQLIARTPEVFAARGQGATQVECQLECEDDRLARIEIGFHRPTADPRHLLEMLQLRLERVSLSGPVRKVRLLVLAMAPLEYHQQELFGEGSNFQQQRQVSLLIDRVSSRLGRKAVLQVVPVADAQPEYGCRYQPLVGAQFKTLAPLGGEGRERGRRAKQHSRTFRALERPLHLESEPILLEVLSVAPQGPPIQFCFQGRQHRIAHAWERERIQTGWWRGQSLARDYYRVETTSGNRFWLFRRLGDGKWFLHGVFE